MDAKQVCLVTLTVVGLFLAGTPAASAQTRETVGIANYTAPAGWTREAEDSVVSYKTADASKGVWCYILIYTTAESRGSLQKDFEAEWATLAAKNLKAAGPTGVRDAKGAGGWESRTGSGTFVNQGEPAAIELTTYRLDRYEFTILVLSNAAREFQPVLERFRNSLVVRAPEQASAPPQAQPAPPRAGGFAFTRTDFDDGWTGFEEKDWVRVTKGDAKVLIHFPIPEDNRYFPQLLDQTLFFWNRLVAPRYADLRNFKNNYNAGSEAANFATGDVVDRRTGKRVHVALFKKRGTYWMEFITPDKAAFVRMFGKDIDSISPFETEWQTLTRMAGYNRFAVAPSDLSGKWTSDLSGLTQYVNSQTGQSAGTYTQTSRETFVFGADSSYSWELGVAAGYVGNIRFQTVKSSGRMRVPSNWQIYFSDIEGKPKTLNANFTSVRGTRLLWLDGVPFGRVN